MWSTLSFCIIACPSVWQCSTCIQNYSTPMSTVIQELETNHLVFFHMFEGDHVWLVDCGTQCVRRVRTWGSLAWRKAQVSKCCLKLPEEQYRDGPDSSQKSTTTRSRGNGHKLQQGVLDERKNKYHHEGVQTLGQVPREAVETVFGNAQNRTGHSHEQDNF